MMKVWGIGSAGENGVPMTICFCVGGLTLVVETSITCDGLG